MHTGHKNQDFKPNWSLFFSDLGFSKTELIIISTFSKWSDGAFITNEYRFKQSCISSRQKPLWAFRNSFSRQWIRLTGSRGFRCQPILSALLMNSWYFWVSISKHERIILKTHWIMGISRRKTTYIKAFAAISSP